MKKSLALLTLSFLFINVFAQVKPFKGIRSSSKHRCYTVEIQTNYLKKHPNSQTPMQFESWLQGKIAERKIANAAKGKFGTMGTITNYTLPIVFHVIHNGEAVGTMPNVAASYIQAQLLQLNKDYANLSGSPYSAASATGIQFALAAQDPTGKTLAEPGIDRVNRKTKKWGPSPFEFTTSITDTIKPATIWDPNRYVNIWLFDAISDGGSTGILGVATFPQSPTLEGLDSTETDKIAGVVIASSTAGSIFSSTTCGSATDPYTLGRTLTHELGHYFGLRHIWGDDYCASDFCDDTPIHYDANYGKPKHPKPNSCGTDDEMFEDYMDYTDDDVMNTFTANQVDRIQTVLSSSPRRMALATSTVPTAIPVGSNKLAFAICSGVLEVNEAVSAGVPQRYKDVTIVLNVEKEATGNAQVIVKTSGTAKKGVDYELIGDTMSFVQGDGAKSFVIRVLDNNAIDGARTAILDLSVSGSGLTAGISAQSLTVTINDDDNKVIGQNKVNILSENFEANKGAFPKGWTTDSTAGSKNFFMVGSTTPVVSTGQFVMLTNNKSTKALTYSASSSYDYAVFSTPVIKGNSYKSIDTLKFRYKVGGAAWDSVNQTAAYATVNYRTSAPFDINSEIYFGDSSGTYGFGPYYGVTTPRSVALVADKTLSNGDFYIDFLWEEICTKVSKPGFCADDISLNATPYSVDSLVSSSYPLIIPSSTNNLIRSTSDDIIASVSGATTVIKDFTASVTQAGAGKVDFNLGSSNFQHSKKVITLNSTSAAASSAYSATLYYTANEVAAWNKVSSLLVLQVNNGVDVYGTLTPDQFTLITPTSISDKRTTDGYVAVTVKAKGFGSFILVDSSVLLPLSWKNVNGAIKNNAAVINWQLYTPDQGIKYTLERSEDGVNFTQIKTGLVTNTFSDASIVAGNNYYYRVIAVAADGSSLYSQVLNIYYLSLDHSFSIAPNPFFNKLMIQNNGSAVGITRVSIVDMVGREIYNKSIASDQVNTTINTTTWLPGVYIVRISNVGSSITNKIIKN